MPDGKNFSDGFYQRNEYHVAEQWPREELMSVGRCILKRRDEIERKM